MFSGQQKGVIPVDIFSPDSYTWLMDFHLSYFQCNYLKMSILAHQQINTSN
jgi:hypothetical protein